ncbi:DoxX family protein [Galbibacter sp. BG1]|uniref:DoxX family protein n=1 Tax=Galbibacter sp. BG1 TaxID=1170699 RepID=UPI002102B92C|nr:DoxX family protein [Galbibacter sp. BG1]
MVKILGERFASGLSTNHPMGAYLEALHQTGYYYTYIGIVQVVAGALLLIPGTVLLGALLYFPVIVNIWILSYALRFEGSYVTSPLMVLANLYLLIWNYDRLRYILPFKQFPDYKVFKKPVKYDTRFPGWFVISVIAVVILVVLGSQFGHEAMPRNSMTDCRVQFTDTRNEGPGYTFCDCIHKYGRALNRCLEEFERTKN